MSEDKFTSEKGLLLKRLMEQQSLSMRKLGHLTGIDAATISRIINGKRKATPEHLQKFAECFNVPAAKFFIAAGYRIEQEKDLSSDDIHSSIDNIQNILESSNLYDKTFTIENIKQQLASYQQFAQTEKGKETILNRFEEKLQKVGSIGPFIDHLKDMFFKFTTRNGKSAELALMGGALLYFILPVDVIPDYLFPIGYLDDAMAVNMVLESLAKRQV